MVSRTLARTAGKGTRDSMTNSHADTPAGIPTGAPRDPWSGGALLRDLDWVQRLAFRLCSDRALAEDLRQEAALALLGRCAPDEVGRRPWLAGIVRNKLRMKRRSDGRRRAREADSGRAEVVSPDVDVVERAETQRKVTEAVLRLREPYRTTVLHRYIDDWTPTEIAARTGTSVDTVKSRLKRGLRALEDDLAGVFRDADGRSEEGPGAGWFSALLPLAVMESNRRALVAAASGARGLASVPLTTAAWLLMIAKFSLVPLALLAVFGLLLLTRSSDGGDAAATIAGPEVAATLEKGAGRVPGARELDDLGRAPVPASVPGADATGVAAPSTCDLGGHVMDDRGRSLEGARVALFRGGDERVATATTGPDGHFSLRVPEQSDPLLELRVEGEWFHASEALEFGGTGLRGRLPLTAGPRDVGTVVLEAAGAVAGRVVDADGAPVAGATVTTLGDAITTTAADGSFRLERLSPGPDTLAVRADGAPIAEVDLTVRAASVAEGIEVWLGPTTSLRGRVVDRRGQPVAGARVELDPVDRPDVSRTESGPDGRFQVPFLRLENAYLRVNAEGFDLWDSEEWDQEVSPESAAIRVELNPASTVEFLVVDGAAGQPIERFGIEIEKGAGSEGMQVSGDVEPGIQDRPGGRAVTEARDEYDSVVVVAGGYEAFRGDVLPDATTAAGVRTQTVRLQPVAASTPGSIQGSIRGRVLRDGAPLANAFVEAEGGIPMGERMKRLAGETGDVFVSAGSGGPLVRTAADGSFTLDGLAMPLYRIRVHALGSAAKVLPVVELADGLADGLAVDLGDVDCGAGGTLRGQVILPPGVAPGGLVASVGLGLGSVRAPLDDGGSFELSHVPTGTQTVEISPRDGDFEHGAEADVLVREGGVTAVQIDASGMGAARVRLQLDLDGAPADGCRVLFLDAEDPETVVAMAFCDESGRVDVRLPAAGDVSVCLMRDLDEFVRHPEARLRLEAGADLEEFLSFRFGAARVAVDAGRTLPPDGALAVEFLDGDGVLHQRLTLEIEDGAILDSSEAAWSRARGTGGGFVLDLRRALVGEWTARVSVLALEPSGDRDPSNRRPEVWLEGRDVTVPGPRR